MRHRFEAPQDHTRSMHEHVRRLIGSARKLKLYDSHESTQQLNITWEGNANGCYFRPLHCINHVYSNQQEVLLWKIEMVIVLLPWSHQGARYVDEFLIEENEHAETRRRKQWEKEVMKYNAGWVGR